MGGCPDSVLGGWDVRGSVHDAAGRLAFGWSQWRSAMGAVGGGQRGEPGRERRGRRAVGDGAGDSGVAVFALIAAYESLMRQVRHSATGGAKLKSTPPIACRDAAVDDLMPGTDPAGPQQLGEGFADRGAAARVLQRQAWNWAQAHRADDDSLLSVREIARRYGRHERWGRLVKRSLLAGEFNLLNGSSVGVGYIGSGGSRSSTAGSR
jgi:hypothetical protein